MEWITGPVPCTPRTDEFGNMMKLFKDYLKKIRAYAIDMETATIFSVGFYNKIPTGALLLVSDQPMIPEGVKTAESDQRVTGDFVETHLRSGLILSNNLSMADLPSGIFGFNYLLASTPSNKEFNCGFPGNGDPLLPALQDFSMELNRGEMLAVVGESGSGKSVMALTLMNLLSKSARIVQGSVIFSPDGRKEVDLLSLPEKKIRSFRGNRLAMIFQEPMTSLNPVMTCGDQLMEPLMQHKKMNRPKARSEALSITGESTTAGSATCP